MNSEFKDLNRRYEEATLNRYLDECDRQESGEMMEELSSEVETENLFWWFTHGRDF